MINIHFQVPDQIKNEVFEFIEGEVVGAVLEWSLVACRIGTPVTENACLISDCMSEIFGQELGRYAAVGSFAGVLTSKALGPYSYVALAAGSVLAKKMFPSKSVDLGLISAVATSILVHLS